MRMSASNEEKIKGKPFFRRHRDALTAAVILAIPLGVWIIFFRLSHGMGACTRIFGVGFARGGSALCVV